MCARMFFKSHNFMESRQFLPLKPKGQNRYRCQRVYYLPSIKEKLQNNFFDGRSTVKAFAEFFHLTGTFS